MRLSAPQRSTAIASLFPVVAAVGCWFVPMPFDQQHLIWLAVAGYVVLAAGCLFRGI